VLRILRQHENIGQAVIMVQREVADRITAEPGSRDYGLLSATAQLYARVEKLFTLPPGAFNPPPQVHSSVIRLTIAPRASELEVNPEEFEEFLKLAFSQKRKTLANNLKQRYRDEAVASALKIAGARSDVRAEALNLEQTAAIFRALSSS